MVIYRFFFFSFFSASKVMMFHDDSAWWHSVQNRTLWSKPSSCGV